MQNVISTKNKPLKSTITWFYFFAFFLALCFIDEVNLDEPTKISTVFHINASKLYVLIGLCSFFVLITLFKKPHFDKVFAGLVASASLGVLPLLYIENSYNYWGNYLPLLITVAAYFICVQTKSDVSEKIYKILCLICSIISIQLIATEYHLFGGLSLGDIQNVEIKGSMKIPIGESNFIAAFLLPMLIYIFTYKRTKLTYLVSILTVYGLMLCRSKNALGLVMLIIFFMLTKKVIKYILKDRSVNKKTKVIIMLFVTAVFGGILVFVMNMIGLVIKELSFSYFSPYTNPIVNYLDTMSSGRVVVLQEQLTRFSNHLFLGNGYSYNIGETKSHNWFLDLLVQRGFIGTVIFIFCIKSIFKSSKPFYSTDKFTRAGVNMLAIMLIQGLFEITFFTISIDFLVWSMAGFLIARRRFLKTQI
jgi:hypothetical protein